MTATDAFILEMEACQKIGELAGIIAKIRREASELDKENEGLRHGLEGVYEERARLIAFLAAVYPSWWDDDQRVPGARVIMIETPEGQLSWHIFSRDLHLFDRCRVAPDGPPFDGHKRSDKYGRLNRLVSRVEPWDWHTHPQAAAPTSPAVTGAISGRTGQMLIPPAAPSEFGYLTETETQTMPRIDG